MKKGALNIGLLLLIAVFSLPLCSQGLHGPGKAIAADKTASVAGAQKNIDAEINAVREELKTNPTYSAYSRLGYLLLDKEALNEAMEAFNKSVELRPDYHNAKTGKGIVLFRKGDLKAAVAVLQEALVLNPDPVETHYALGLVYEKMGDLDKAIAEYKEGIRKFEQGRK